MARYDVTIYEPASAPLYLEGAVTAGGAERQMVILARSLASLGLRVCHVVSRVDNLPLRHDGVELVLQEPILPGAGTRTRTRRIAQALQRGDAGVYVQRSAGLATGLVGAFARAHRRAFVYSTSSPLDLTRGLPLLWHESLGLWLGKRVANAIVVQTHDQIATAPSGLHLVHIPSFCEPAAVDGDTERDTFLWVGRSASYKNPLAFVELARQVPEARFTIVGIDPSNPDDDVVTAAARVPNLDLVPPLPRSAVLPFYRRAVAVVNTSDFEGFPNTFMEGWARGALALSLNVDPDRVIVRHGIGAVAGGSPTALAAAARRLWQARRQSAEERGAAVRYVTEHHAPDRVAARWLELVTSLRRRRVPG